MQSGKEVFVFMKRSIPQRSTAGRLSAPITLRVTVVAALLAALSIVLGKYLAISLPTLRFSFENLPILMAGILFGPVVGGTVGCLADLVGCMMVGYEINPIITLGGTLVGVIVGLVPRMFPRSDHISLRTWVLYLSVFLAHAVGSMTVKTIGMAIYYGTPTETLLWRIPLYLVIGALEGGILHVLLRNRLIAGEIRRLLSSR